MATRAKHHNQLIGKVFVLASGWSARITDTTEGSDGSTYVHAEPLAAHVPAQDWTKLSEQEIKALVSK